MSILATELSPGNRTSRGSDCGGFAIVEGHDVHSESHENIFNSLMTHRFYKFEVSAYSFFALDAFAFDGEGKSRKDTLCVLYNREQLQTREALAQGKDNAAAPGPEHGTLGNQLGPNKNGSRC